VGYIFKPSDVNPQNQKSNQLIEKIGPYDSTAESAFRPSDVSYEWCE
jgi:hypothetical protein